MISPGSDANDALRLWFSTWNVAECAAGLLRHRRGEHDACRPEQLHADRRQLSHRCLLRYFGVTTIPARTTARPSNRPEGAMLQRGPLYLDDRRALQPLRARRDYTCGSATLAQHRAGYFPRLPRFRRAASGLRGIQPVWTRRSNASAPPTAASAAPCDTAPAHGRRGHELLFEEWLTPVAARHLARTRIRAERLSANGLLCPGILARVRTIPAAADTGASRRSAIQRIRWSRARQIEGMGVSLSRLRR